MLLQIHLPDNIPDTATIDLTRYRRNPVLLLDHKYNSDPIGLLENLTQEDGKVYGGPKFHCETEESCDALTEWAKNPDAFILAAGGFWDRKNTFTLQEVSLILK